MRTYTLSKELGDYESACNFLERKLVKTSSDGDAFQVRYRSISGLFMLDKPLCVRADLTKELGWRSVGEVGKNATFLPESIKQGIRLWYKRGTGTPIIHMRTYLTNNHIAMGDRNRNAPNESYPYKVDDETFFYHIGSGYGSGSLWGVVHTARSNLSSVPEAVYQNYKSRFLQYIEQMESWLSNGMYTSIYGHMIEQEPNHWGNSLDLDHEYEDTERLFAIFKWKNGEVFDVYTNAEGETLDHSSFDLIQTVLEDSKLHL